MNCIQKFKQLLKSLLLIQIFSKAPSTSLIKFRVNRFLGYNLLLNHSAYQFSPLINEGRRQGIKADTQLIAGLLAGRTKGRNKALNK